MITIKYNERYRYRDMGGVFRPVLQAKVNIFGHNMAVPVLIDSGADCTTMPLAWFRGVDLSSYVRSSSHGIGGESREWIIPSVTIEMGRKTIRCPVRISELFDAPFALLGRQEVFPKVKLGFREMHNEFYIAHEG